MRYRILVSGALIAIGCGGKSQGGAFAIQPQGAGPALITSIGDTLQLTVSGGSANVVWNSANPSVATVSSSGLVTAVTNGTATILAGDGPLQASIDVVVAQKVSAVAVTPSQVTVSQNSTQDFTAAAADARGHPVAGTMASWQSSNTALVTIDGAGHATIGAASSVTQMTITATISGVQGTSTMTVDPSLVPVDHVTISGGNVTLKSIGETNGFSAQAFDAANQPLPQRTILWSISDATVVSIDQTGLATAKANGAATVTANSGGKSDSRLVTVQQVVASVSVSPASASITKGSTQQFSATAKDARGVVISPTLAATWGTSSPTIATIDSNGLATGVSVGGPITVTATISAVPGTAQLTVTSAVTTRTIEWTFTTGGANVTTTVAAGTLIQWHNGDSVAHSVVPATNPPPSSTGTINGGATSPTQTINAPGTYHYVCGIHPTQMRGTITVQ
jgi:hypothetical protein